MNQEDARSDSDNEIVLDESSTINACHASVNPDRDGLDYALAIDDSTFRKTPGGSQTYELQVAEPDDDLDQENLRLSEMEEMGFPEEAERRRTLPLPDEDRFQIEHSIRRRILRQFTILDMIVITTLVAALTGLFQTLPLGIYMLILNLSLLTILFVRKLSRPLLRVSLLILAGFYFAAIFSWFAQP